jgi:hypothetical protein
MATALDGFAEGCLPSRDASFFPRSVGRAAVVDPSVNDREVPCFCLEDFCGRSTCSRDPSRCLFTRKGLSCSIGWPSRICEGGRRRETVKLGSIAGEWLKMNSAMYETYETKRGMVEHKRRSPPETGSLGRTTVDLIDAMVSVQGDL